MTTFVVAFTYDASPSVLAQLRPERHRYFSGLEERGVLLASGQVLSGPLGNGMLIMRAEDEAHARQLLSDDPYVRDGHVAQLDVSAWNPTSGTWITR